MRLIMATVLATVLTTAPLDAQTAREGGEAATYPDVPEPMVFDMVRPLGARRGELEINTLVQKNGSGPHAKAEWAPEVEYAVADGFAVELELPVEGLGISAYKMGLQGTFGTFASGRGVHGVQYLGLYDRTDRQWRSTLLYLVGLRFDERWSTMSMIGAGDVALSGHDRSSLIVNHSTFYDLSGATLAGVEVNMRLGGSIYKMIMPQVHHRLPNGFSIQGGVGAVRDDGEPWRPRAGVRVIKQF